MRFGGARRWVLLAHFEAVYLSLTHSTLDPAFECILPPSSTSAAGGCIHLTFFLVFVFDRLSPWLGLFQYFPRGGSRHLKILYVLCVLDGVV